MVTIWVKIYFSVFNIYNTLVDNLCYVYKAQDIFDNILNGKKKLGLDLK